MIPAIRAAPTTSPFLALPSRTRSSVDFFITTRPSATATRSVGFLCEASTMRASPRRPKCERRRVVTVLFRRMLPCAGKKRSGRRSDIVLSHQAFANEERVDVDAREPRKIGWRENAALADNDAVLRHFRR